MKQVFTIAKYTFLEILKSKILVNILMLGFALFCVTFVAYQFTYGEPEKIALDFGLGALSISSVGIALFFGVNLLAKEIESRTVYMIISRPIERYQFYFGKIIGLICILSLNVLILSVLTLSVYFFVGGSYANLLLWSIFFIMIEAVVVLLVVSTLTLLTTSTLSIMLSIGVYISGHAIPAATETSFVKNSVILKYIIDIYHFLLPGFYKFNIKNFVLYKQDLDTPYIISVLVYGILYMCFLIGIGIFIFNRKSLD